MKTRLRAIPPHPGGVLRDVTLPAAGLSCAEAAEEIGVPRRDLQAVLDGRAPITPELAVRLGKTFGGCAESWHRDQAAHDIAAAAQREDEFECRRVRSASTDGEPPFAGWTEPAILLEREEERVEAARTELAEAEQRATWARIYAAEAEGGASLDEAAREAERLAGPFGGVSDFDGELAAPSAMQGGRAAPTAAVAEADSDYGGSSR